jgi:hypothetical protein
MSTSGRRNDVAKKLSFTPQGIPILSLDQKLKALGHCMTGGDYEDAAGHLCDLLDHCRRKIEPSVGDPFKNLVEMVRHYGKHPAPITDSLTKGEDSV